MLVHAGKHRTEDKLKIQTIHKLNTTQEKNQQHITQQNKTSLVQLPVTTLGQETRWAYSTMLPSPYGATGSSGHIRARPYTGWTTHVVPHQKLTNLSQQLSMQEFSVFIKYNITSKVKVKSFPEPKGPCGGADLRFIIPQPDTS